MKEIVGWFYFLTGGAVITISTMRSRYDVLVLGFLLFLFGNNELNSCFIRDLIKDNRRKKNG